SYRPDSIPFGGESKSKPICKVISRAVASSKTCSGRMGITFSPSENWLSTAPGEHTVAVSVEVVGNIDVRGWLMDLLSCFPPPSLKVRRREEHRASICPPDKLNLSLMGHL